LNDKEIYCYSSPVAGIFEKILVSEYTVYRAVHNLAERTDDEENKHLRLYEGGRFHPLNKGQNTA
jgi:hypothetical protein